MLENQFISFGVTPPARRVVLPARVLEYQPSFYGRILLYIDSEVTEVALLNADREVIYTQEITIGENEYKSWNMTNLFYYANIQTPLTIGATYFIRTLKDTSTYRYSNPLVIADESVKFSQLFYSCSEDAFGFPFQSAGEYAGFYVPLLISSPQNVQDDKTYVKANGEVVTLFAKYYKEWEGETEYLSAEMHDKIVAALSCDFVYINGKRVTKSDKYQVDWENYDLDCDGVTKLARATFKVRENTNQRNSNY